MNLDSEEDALLLPSIVPADYVPPQHLPALEALTLPTPATTTIAPAQPDHNPLNALPY